MQMDREGIHRVRFKLASGVLRYYYYAFRGGPKFWTCDQHPVDEARLPRAFIKAYDEAMSDHKQRLAATPNTVDALIDRYQDATEHKSLDPETQSFYEESFPAIREEFGPDEVEIFLDRKTRKQVKQWRDRWHNQPRTADKRVGALVKVLNYAVDEGDLEFHVAGNINKLYKSDRAIIIWDDAELGRLLSCCGSVALRLSVMLAAHSGIRRTDLVQVPLSADKGDTIEFYTSKSNGRRFVGIPVTRGIRAVLNELKALRATFQVQPVTLIYNSLGRPWTPGGFSASFKKARAKSGVEKRLHDLRGTACTLYIRAGIGDDDVAEIMGWSKDTIKQMKRVYATDSAMLAGMIKRIEGTQKEQKL